MINRPPICIYHHPCYDGFTAAWAVWRALGDAVEFHRANYGHEPPDVTGRDVIIVDFSYKLPVLMEMAASARTILVLDHHKTAAEDLANLMAPSGAYYVADDLVSEAEARGMPYPIFAIFDMNRSGAGIAWDFFHPGQPRPKLIDYVEDRDLWRFALPRSREVSATLHATDFSFEEWDTIAAALDGGDLAAFADVGGYIVRKHHKDIDEAIRSVKRRMTIGGFDVPVANMPYAWASDAGNKMAQGEPFAACYVDGPNGRSFSLRSTADGVDVSEIAKSYGGGGHRNAAGFKMPAGWEGEACASTSCLRCQIAEAIESAITEDRKPETEAGPLWRARGKTLQAHLGQVCAAAVIDLLASQGVITLPPSEVAH